MIQGLFQAISTPRDLDSFKKPESLSTKLSSPQTNDVLNHIN